jgi:hypothetical protein
MLIIKENHWRVVSKEEIQHDLSCEKINLGFGNGVTHLAIPAFRRLRQEYTASLLHSEEEEDKKKEEEEEEEEGEEEEEKNY